MTGADRAEKRGLERRAEALAFAQRLDTDHPGWLSVLPDCPCTVEQARQSTDFLEDAWYVSLFLSVTGYHPGAKDSFRSARGWPSVPGTSHGQQCIYDRAGRLIVEGPGAGTPDLWSPITHPAEHRQFDVQPFEALGWETYNRYWRPNRGFGCEPGDYVVPGGRSVPG